MEIPWTYERCILCRSTGQMTEEHIIPESLGGRLYARFLCKPCNDKLGHSIEARAAEDPSVKLAVENLADRIPDLAKAIREGQRYVVRSAGGFAQAYLKGGELRIRGARAADGSVIQSTPDGRDHIATVLRKTGVRSQEIGQKLSMFDGAPENTPIKLTDELTVIKWRIDELHPALDTEMLDDRVLLKIAFEYFAAHAAETIYLDVPQLNEIRQVLQGAQASSDTYSVERLHTRTYRPLHGLALEQAKPWAVVAINLFGWLFFRVHLKTVSINSPRYRYTCDLESKQEYFEEIKEPPNSRLQRTWRTFLSACRNWLRCHHASK